MKDLPPRLTTAEVAELLRVSVATVLRRLRAGTLGMKPIDRNAQFLFARDDVLRVRDGERVRPAGESRGASVSVEAIRRRAEAGRRRRKPKSLTEAR